MGQVISIILGRLFGGKKKIESVKPKTGHEEYSPLPSYYIDIIEEHSHKGEDAAEAAATPASFHPRHRVVPISPQQQAVLDPPVEGDLHQPLITANSIVTDTGGAEETKELILEATSKEAISIDGFQWTIDFTRINKSTEEESFHPHNHAVTVSQRQQQQHHHPQVQEQEDVSEPLVEVDFHQPLIATNSIVTDTAGVKGGKELILKATTKEPNSTKRFKRKIKEKEHVIRSTAEEALHPHHHVVTVSQQQRHHQQQQEQEVVSDPLVEVDLHQPLITTNSIVANTGSVEETKKLTLKATTKETTSTKRFEWKIKEKEPILKSTAEEAFHPHHQIVTVSQHQQQQQHHHHQQHQEEEVASDPLVEVDLHNPLITTNSIATNTARVEETKELILKATTEEATSTKRFKWKIKEKEPIIKSAAEEAFHPRHHVVTISQQQQQQHHHQQHKEEEIVSDPLVEVDLHYPLITTTSIVNNTVGVEETKELIPIATTKEATPTKRFMWKIKEKESISKSAAEEAFHPCHHVVTISQQQQHQQQRHQQQRDEEEQEVVSNPLVDVDLRKPLIRTNPIVTDIAGVEETKELILKATTEEATSTKRFKRKIEEKNHKNEKATVRKIGPYVSTQKILLVGEGDFSFSASLAVAFGNASNIVATSLDEKVFLMNNYGKSMVNIEKLKSRGALVIHNVDATEMAEHKSLQGMKFDRIIFNFPHTCYFGRTWFEMGLNQTLVVGFLRNAKKMIEEDGEIHVTHKTSSAYIKWHIVQLGLMEDLNLIEASPFDPKVYPGYKTKYGYRGDKNFYYFPCNIYKFGLVC